MEYRGGCWQYKQFIRSCGECWPTVGEITESPPSLRPWGGAAANRVALVSQKDQCRWDARYASHAPPPDGALEPPGVFAAYANEFPTSGRALDLACGQGLGAVWLARRGLDVWGLDISPVAIGRARDLARRSGVGGHCRFDVADLDDGLPAGPPVDVILCHRFRDRRLDPAIIERLAPRGLLAIAVLSEVGAEPGRFRAAPGELAAAFADLEDIVAREGEGCAWLLARARDSGFQSGADRR
jgi:SAM-dependent methyltransferase